MKAVMYSLLGLISVLALTFGLNYFGLVQFRFFAPKYENARREVFENTQSYVEAKRQSITKHFDEFRKASADDKVAIRAMVLQEFANFDTELLTTQQQVWYKEIVQ